MKYYSQYGQDQYILENIFLNKTNGYYVDIGAHDGISLSNTKVLEDIGWEGVCIEPNPKVFQKLLKNRKCLCYDIAISESECILDFLSVEGYSEMLSGILENYDIRHLERIDNEILYYGGEKVISKVLSKTFSSVIDRKDIDYVSIDVEGSELTILKSIDFNKHNIKCFSVENAYNSVELNTFLLDRGYSIANSMGCDILFLKD